MAAALLSDRVLELLAQGLARSGPLVVLTGAGISAESGIPTFRGAQGYWRIGSQSWRPEELATQRAFRRLPDAVWAWYLYRRSICRAAAPNAAHRALVRLEQLLGDRFLLVTQNVDGLHPRAGQSPGRTFQIHGNLEAMRCARDCTAEVLAIPSQVDTSWSEDRQLGERELCALRCPQCGARTRPHVLWFDECYDEERYRSEKPLRTAARAALLLVVGTSGATTLPARMVEVAVHQGAPLVVLDLEPTTFADVAQCYAHGAFAAGKAGALVPAFVEEAARMLAARSRLA